MNERDTEFFQPLWRRIAIIIVCVLWSCWEWYSGQSFWGVIAAGMAAWSYYNFFVTFKELQPDSKPDDS